MSDSNENKTTYTYILLGLFLVLVIFLVFFLGSKPDEFSELTDTSELTDVDGEKPQENIENSNPSNIGNSERETNQEVGDDNQENTEESGTSSTSAGGGGGGGGGSGSSSSSVSDNKKKEEKENFIPEIKIEFNAEDIVRISAIDNSTKSEMKYKNQSESDCDIDIPDDAVVYFEGEYIFLDEEKYNGMYVCFWSQNDKGVGRNISPRVQGIIELPEGYP